MLYLKVGLIFIISIYLCFWCWFRRENPRLWNTLTVIIMGIYFCDVLWITVIREERLVEQLKVLIPFYAYYKIIFTGWNGLGVYIAIALIGNTLLFLPIGLLLSQIVISRYNLWTALLVGLICSLLIEWYQFSNYVGIFEVDDLIQNAWGSMIGCGIGNVVTLFRDKGNKRLIIRNLVPLLLCISLIGSSSLISYLIWRL